MELPLQKNLTNAELKNSSKCDSNPKNWDDLDASLRSLLPNEEGITYVVTHFADLPKEEFSGAPTYAFVSTVRVNVSNIAR